MASGSHSEGARAEVMMLLHKAAVPSAHHGRRAHGRPGGVGPAGRRPQRPSTAYADRDAAWGGGADGRGRGRPQTAVPRARGGPRPGVGEGPETQRKTRAARSPGGEGGSLDGWLRSVGIGLVKAPRREPPKKAPEPTVDEQEGIAWRLGDKVLLSRAPEGARAKLQRHREREQQARKERLLAEGHAGTIRAEELYFAHEEDLDRYVWAKSGKVLAPFERVELDAAQEEALAQERRRRAGPGRADDAWRVHGKASWVADCVGEEHALRCEGALRRGCMSEAARRKGAVVLGTKAESAWRDGGKVLGRSSKECPGEKAEAGLLLDHMERLKRAPSGSGAGYAKELQPQRRMPIVEVFDKPWRAWGQHAHGKSHGKK